MKKAVPPPLKNRPMESADIPKNRRPDKHVRRRVNRRRNKLLLAGNIIK